MLLCSSVMMVVAVAVVVVYLHIKSDVKINQLNIRTKLEIHHANKVL